MLRYSLCRIDDESGVYEYLQDVNSEGLESKEGKEKKKKRKWQQKKKNQEIKKNERRGGGKKGRRRKWVEKMSEKIVTS